MSLINKMVYVLLMATPVIYGCRWESSEDNNAPKKPAIDTVSGKVLASDYEPAALGTLESLESVLKTDKTTYFLKDEKTPKETRKLMKPGDLVTLTIDPKNKRKSEIGRHYYFNLGNLLVVNGDTLNIAAN